MDSFIIIGGDKRQRVLGQTLEESGKKVFYMANSENLDNIDDYTHIILPVPVTRDGINIYSDDKNFKLSLEMLIEKITSAQKVFGGGIPSVIAAALKNKGVTCSDFLKNERFLVDNALLTSQGALRLLLTSTEKYIPLSRILIIGFGRVAAALAAVLKALNAEIYIATRNPFQLESASCLGYQTVNLANLTQVIADFDFIFGTVPHTVLKGEIVSAIKDDSIYFELASKPFTACEDDFRTCGKRYVDGGALPGKYLSEASGRLIAEYINSGSD